MQPAGGQVGDDRAHSARRPIVGNDGAGEVALGQIADANAFNLTPKHVF